jgi:hypothetical protein
LVFFPVISYEPAALVAPFITNQASIPVVINFGLYLLFLFTEASLSKRPPHDMTGIKNSKPYLLQNIDQWNTCKSTIARPNEADVIFMRPIDKLKRAVKKLILCINFIKPTPRKTSAEYTKNPLLFRYIFLFIFWIYLHFLVFFWLTSEKNVAPGNPRRIGLLSMFVCSRNSYNESCLYGND